MARPIVNATIGKKKKKPMTGAPWHDYYAPMRAALLANDQAEFDRLKTEAFAKPNIRIHDGMAYEANVFNHAFTAFGCSNMGLRLVEAGAAFNNAQYLNLSEQCFNTIGERWDDGGLLSNQGNWLHARTSETKQSRGAELNKTLIAIRDMLNAARKFDLVSRTAFADSLRTQAEAACLHITSRSAYPNWEDFVATKANGEVINRSWLGYGLIWQPRELYFLNDNPEKNGDYAISCVEILMSIYGVAPFDMSSFDNFIIGDSGLNIFAFSKRSFDLKKADGWYVDSNTGGNGFFGKLDQARNPEPVISTQLSNFLLQHI